MNIVVTVHYLLQLLAPPLIFCMTSFVCKCALFGIVKIALSRRCLIAASSVRLLSRSYGRSDSDDRRGVGHSKSNSKESPTAKLELERSFQLLGVNKYDCTVEQIRKAYIDLVKRYHPDSWTPHASAEKSAEVCHNTICTCNIICSSYTMYMYYTCARIPLYCHFGRSNIALALRASCSFIKEKKNLIMGCSGIIWYHL